MPFGKDKLPIEPPVRRRRLNVPGVEPAATELMPWNVIQGYVEMARGLIYLDNTKKDYDKIQEPAPIPQPSPRQDDVP